MHKLILPDPNHDVKKVIISPKQIYSIVNELARQVAAHYSERGIHEIVTVAIMKGAAYFQKDFETSLHYQAPWLNVHTDQIRLERWGNSVDAPRDRKTRIVYDTSVDLRDRHVLVLEDVIQTGYTMIDAVSVLRHKGPRSLRVCVLIDKNQDVRLKPEEIANPVGDFDEKLPSPALHHVGFAGINKEFLVGYGMDYKQHCRNWPFVATLTKDFYMRAENKDSE